jgi:hypothetical protein
MYAYGVSGGGAVIVYLNFHVLINHGKLAVCNYSFRISHLFIAIAVFRLWTFAAS